MSALALAPDRPADSWEEALTAAIRPPFAVERFIAHPGDVLFGKAECAVPYCPIPPSSWSRALRGESPTLAATQRPRPAA